MTDQPDHAADHAALHDRITERTKAANDYLATLTAPELMGEVRCLITSILSTLDTTGYKYSPLGMATYLLNNAMSRFDADGSPYPLPEAVTGVECRCDTPDVVGILSRVEELAGLIREVQAHHDQHTQPDGDPAEAIAAAVRDALASDPRLAGAMIVDVTEALDKLAARPPATPPTSRRPTDPSQN